MFLGIGNPLLDISAEVGQDTLDKYAVKLNDAILCEEKHMPVYKDLVDNFKVQYIAGGATQNSVRVAQWMTKPNSTSFIGCIGNDEFGETLRKSATDDGVAVHYLVDEKVSTGTCAVLVKDQDRSLIANLSAANEYKHAHYETEAIQKVVAAAKFVYSAGFFLTVSPPTVQAIGAHCAAADDKVFCMNLSAPFICQFFKDPLMAGIEFADIVFGNESEAAALAETLGLEDKSVKALAAHIAALPSKVNAKHGKRKCIITQGALPTVVAFDGKVVEYKVPTLEKKDIVDANGAGDSFVGGFMAALMAGKGEEDCVQTGHYAASVILGVSGCAMHGNCKTEFAC